MADWNFPDGPFCEDFADTDAGREFPVQDGGVARARRTNDAKDGEMRLTRAISPSCKQAE